MKKAKVVGRIPQQTLKDRQKASKDAKRVGSFGVILKEAFKEKGIHI